MMCNRTKVNEHDRIVPLHLARKLMPEWIRISLIACRATSALYGCTDLVEYFKRSGAAD